MPRLQPLTSHVWPVVSTLSGVGPLTEVPVPVNVITCGLVGALSTTEIVAVRVPVAVGVKLTTSVHEAPAATELPTQKPLPWGRCCGWARDWAIWLMNIEAVPVLVNVTVCGALEVPTSCGP